MPRKYFAWESLVSVIHTHGEGRVSARPFFYFSENERLESRPTCRLKAGATRSAGFQPAGWGTFLSPVSEVLSHPLLITPGHNLAVFHTCVGVTSRMQ